VVLDALADPRTDKGSVEFFGDRSILVAPLTRRGRTLGTLFLNHVGHYYTFSDEDVATTMAIASQAAVAIDNARLFGDARRRGALLSRSFRFAAEALTSGIESEHTLRNMIQLAVETVDADGGSISLLDETGRGAYVVATAGEPAPAAGNSAAEFALRVNRSRVGMLRLWRRSPPFDGEERELMESFAGHVQTALEHQRLNAGLQEERQRAQQAERTKADFVSMVSHELRTPLALIKGYVSTLLRPSLGLSPAMQTRFLEGIDTAADRLRRLIDNLLSAGAVEASVFLYQPRPLAVETLLRDAVAEVAMLAEGREIRVHTESEDLRVLGDPDQLTQVFENLIGNALKYAPGRSPVCLRAARHDGNVRVSVEDSGPGIPTDALDLIFEKFYRVSKPAPSPPSMETQAEAARDGRRPSGLGLGLYISRRIVEAHGGRIWAANLPGGGAAFHIELPASVGGERAATDAPSALATRAPLRIEGAVNVERRATDKDGSAGDGPAGGGDGATAGA
jgi:signal transduction histidine kinase